MDCLILIGKLSAKRYYGPTSVHDSSCSIPANYIILYVSSYTTAAYSDNDPTNNQLITTMNGSIIQASSSSTRLDFNWSTAGDTTTITVSVSQTWRPPNASGNGIMISRHMVWSIYYE